MKSKNFGDWAVALVVVACSVALFAALAMALSGRLITQPGRTLKVYFHDVTGIKVSSNVRYAGAPAGRVAGIRMLSPQERIATGDPRNVVELSLAVDRRVPALPADVEVSVAADTLLADKFILISGGDPAGPILDDKFVLQGVTPVTFDRLTRNLDSVIDGISGILKSSPGDSSDLFDRLQAFIQNAQKALDEARGLITSAKPVVQDASALLTDSRQLITTNRDGITRTVTNLERASVSLDKLTVRATTFINTTETKITPLLSDFRVTAENLKITSTYTRFLLRSLAARPQQLIWGTRRPNELPSPEEILKSAKPLPYNP